MIVTKFAVNSTVPQYVTFRDIWQPPKPRPISEEEAFDRQASGHPVPSTSYVAA